MQTTVAFESSPNVEDNKDLGDDKTKVVKEHGIESGAKFCNIGIVGRDIDALRPALASLIYGRLIVYADWDYLYRM